MDHLQRIIFYGVLSFLVASVCWSQSANQYYESGMRHYNENRYDLAVEQFAMYRALAKQEVEADPQFKRQFNDVFDFSKRETEYAITTIQKLRQRGAFVEYEVDASGAADTWNSKKEKRQERVKGAGRKPQMKRRPPKYKVVDSAATQLLAIQGKYKIAQPLASKTVTQSQYDQCKNKLNRCAEKLTRMQEKLRTLGKHQTTRSACDEEHDWFYAKSQDTVDAYRRYIKKCNPAAHITEATQRINQLQR